MKEKEFFDRLILEYTSETGHDPTEYSMGQYLDMFTGAYPAEKSEVRLTRKVCVRILHEFLKNVLGYPDIDWDRANGLKDIYECRVCANSIAQVYERGIMPEYSAGVFGLDVMVSDEEALGYIEVIRGYIGVNMLTREEALSYGLSFPDTYQDAPFNDPNWQLVRYSPNKKAFLWTYEKDDHICLNVKTEPDKAYYWRQIYRSVIPGYHQNKEHWNTVILDGSIPDDAVKMMIAESYDLISDSPTKRIYEAVRKIPRGKVATYGTIARLAGNERMSRAVGNALHKNPDPDGIPCYRVVNAQGRLAEAFVFGGAGVQESLLRADGIEVVDNHVDLTVYGWEG